MRVERLVSIVVVLLEHNQISTTQLAQQFGVTQRTIFRDLQAIAAAGIPLTGYAGAQGGIALSDAFKLERGLFTTRDVYAVLREFGVEPDNEQHVLDTLAKTLGMPPQEQWVIL